jgi:phage pi2 protein 07
MQKLNVTLSIQIPDDMVLIKKVEYEEMKDNELKGVYWNMKDLEQKTTRKSEWIKENILYPSRFRKILDAENGGFVFYPKVKGQTWVFQASKMTKFLDVNFTAIFTK